MARIRHGSWISSVFQFGLLAWASFYFSGCTHRGTRSPANDNAGENTNDAIAAFKYVHQVTTQGPRCVNCHVSGDRPIQLEGAERRFHTMNVQRNIINLGMQCTSCHGTSNFDEAHMPPGTTLDGQAHWGMPRAHKSFDQNTSAEDLCRLWKDPNRNEFEADDDSGHKTNMPRTPQDLLVHVSNDPLVNWTWNPGPGRTPSSGTHEEFVKNFAIWVSAGAPCPQGE